MKREGTWSRSPSPPDLRDLPHGDEYGELDSAFRVDEDFPDQQAIGHSWGKRDSETPRRQTNDQFSSKQVVGGIDRRSGM